MRPPRRPPDDEILDAEIVGESGQPRGDDVPGDDEQRRARRLAVGDADLDLQVTGERPLYGSRRFFQRAAEQLLVSTRHGLELAGACYARRARERTLLVALNRRGSGLPGRVAISPEWGSILWHTHPGLRGSLAAFSDEDLEAAKRSRRPLLVIGFGGLSPDVLSTLALPLGIKPLILGSAVKGLLSLEKRGTLRERLIAAGVAARVCYPSGRIVPVLRLHATPLQHAMDDVSFVIDQSVGTVERVGQRAIRSLISKAVKRP